MSVRLGSQRAAWPGLVNLADSLGLAPLYLLLRLHIVKMPSISLADPRLGRQYLAGPRDPAFWRDTLQRIVDSADDMFFVCKVPRLLEALRLHREATAAEAASQCMALLLSSSARHTRELTAVADLLGRDRESLRLTGLTPREACEAAFVDEYKAVEAKKQDGARSGGICPQARAARKAVLAAAAPRSPSPVVRRP